MILLRRLRDDRRGAALIEMALITPVLATIVVGMIDLSNAYSTKLQLEQAAQRTIEHAEQTEVSTTMMDALKAEGASAANVPASQVTVDYWLECNGTRAANYDSTCTTGQTYARYLTVNIQGSYTPIFSTKWAGANADGSFTINGKAGIRTQ